MVALGLVALGACTPDVSGAPAIDSAELETQVASRYPGKTEDTTVAVTCGGDLLAEVDATQDCVVRVNEQQARVRASVTEVTGQDTVIEVLPFVTAERVARTLLAALAKEGFSVDKVTCPAELIGQVGEAITCTARPNKGTGRITATVTDVRGLHVDFDYELT